MKTQVEAARPIWTYSTIAIAEQKIGAAATAQFARDKRAMLGVTPYISRQDHARYDDLVLASHTHHVKLVQQLTRLAFLFALRPE